MAFNINDFKSILTGGGARPNLFRIEMDMPFSDSITNRKLTFTARAASIPSSDLEVITVPYFGREIKVAGDRTYPAWQITVINDEDFLVREALERWSHSINTPVTNLNESGGPLGYKQRDADVKQYSKTGQIIRQYTFRNIFPTSVSSMDLAWDTNNSIQEFTVDFAYDYWERVGPSPVSRSSVDIARNL